MSVWCYVWGLHVVLVYSRCSREDPWQPTERLSRWNRRSHPGLSLPTNGSWLHSQVNAQHTRPCVNACTHFHALTLVPTFCYVDAADKSGWLGIKHYITVNVYFGKMFVSLKPWLEMHRKYTTELCITTYVKRNERFIRYQKTLIEYTFKANTNTNK